jgi:signal peptidase I
VRGPIERLAADLPHPVRVALDWVVTLVGATALVLVIKAFVVNPYRIPSSSMEPTLHCAQPAPGCLAGTSDRVLANRLVYHLREPRRGDLVVFETPPEAQRRCGASGTFVKRLIGLPGETVTERDGVVFIDGERLREPYVRGRGGDGASGRWSIGRDAYFMMGDNRANSCDSRAWGAVSRDSLIGTVFVTYWPPARVSFR